MNWIERLVVAVALMLAVTAVCAQEAPPPEQDPAEVVPEWPERVLYFEVSDKPLELTDFQARPGVIWPKFAATFEARVSNSAYEALFCVSRGGDSPEKRTEALLGTAAAARFSPRQVELVKTSPWLRKGEPRYRGANREKYTAYAMSESDARLMVEAAFELLDSPGSAGFEEMKGRLREWQTNLREARKELAEARRGQEEANKPYAVALKASGYENRESARRDLERLDVSLRSLEVTIAGINAKIAMIEKLCKSRDLPRDRDTQLRLDQLHVEQDIELAGALARNEVLGEQRDRARAVLRTRKAYDAAIDKTKELDDQVRTCKLRIEQWVKRLEDPGNSVGRVRLMDSVVVQPIAYPGE